MSHGKKRREGIEPAAEQEPAVYEEIEPDKVAADIEALQQELERLKADVAETHDSYLRTLADFDNFRKRQREEAARQANLAREEIILKVLPIIDNFERALESAEAQHTYESLVEGVLLTLRQMQDMLEREGVEPIEAAGKEFDPEVHEAMMRVETGEFPPNTVIDEIERGYTLDGKVLRPARVRVAVSG